MIPFRGRSAYRTKVPGKLDPDGYKIWALAWKGYLYDWLYYSGTVGTFVVANKSGGKVEMFKHRFSVPAWNIITFLCT